MTNQFPDRLPEPTPADRARWELGGRLGHLVLRRWPPAAVHALIGKLARDDAEQAELEALHRTARGRP